MTIEALIQTVLGKIRKDFYGPERIREFKRDERALLKAVSRYGYECSQRGWEFEADDIYQSIMQILRTIRESKVDVQYLPSYLEGAMTRHVGQRAEELSARAKSIKPKVAKIVREQQGVVAIREQSGAELLGKLYTEVKKQAQRAKQAKKEKKPPAAAQQASLFESATSGRAGGLKEGEPLKAD